MVTVEKCTLVVKCDLCAKPCAGIFVDGRTVTGSWANMCETCHVANGGKTGLGIGQKYELTAGGHWIKIEG